MVVVLGLSPTGLYAIRELSRAGFSVLAASHEPGCAAASNLLTHPDRAWLARSDAELLSRLLDTGAGETRRPILLPTSDRHIQFIADHFSELAEMFTFQDSYSPAFVFQLLDKGRLYRLCARYGMPLPATWYPEAPAEWTILADLLPFPCILKPKLIHLAVPHLKGRKVLLARTREEYLRITGRIPEGVGGWVIQEVIPGPESNTLLLAGYFDRGGNPIETFTARKLRQHPPGFGSASLVQSESDEEVVGASTRFLKQIGFKGVCGVEFKRDPRDGTLKVIEINARPTLWFQLSHACGKRIVESACRDLAGMPVHATAPQLDGVLWRHTLKDLYSKFFYVVKGRGFVLPPPEMPEELGRRGRTWAVYDAEDPSPAYVEPLYLLRKLFARVPAR